MCFGCRNRSRKSAEAATESYHLNTSLQLKIVLYSAIRMGADEDNTEGVGGEGS